jgi:hypothetical protein
MTWPETQMLTCLQAYLWSNLKAGGPHDVGLVTCDLGDWQIPAPDQISEVLPAIIIVPGDVTGTLTEDELGRQVLSISGDLHINYLRSLGHTERKNYAVRLDTSKIKEALSPSNLKTFPGWTNDMSFATKFVPSRGFIRSVQMQDGFYSEDPALDIEHETITFHFLGDLHVTL